MTTIIKAADAAQFLGLVPHLLGFHPSESIVLVPFGGASSLGALRIDLEPHAGVPVPTTARQDAAGWDAGPRDTAGPRVLVESPADAVDRIAATAIGMVCRIAAADGVAAVVYTDEAIHATSLPREQLARALARRADACGIELRDALCVAPNGWASYLDPHRPEHGHPLDLLHTDGPNRLPPIAGDQHSGAELPAIDPTRLADVASALDALTAAVDADPATIIDSNLDPRALETLLALDDIPDLIEAMLEQDAAALPPFEAALAVLCLSRPSVRDVAMLQWCGCIEDGDAALDAQLRWEAGEPYPDELGSRVWGDGACPDPQRLAAGLAFARECAALASGPRRAAVLGLCAWLAWAQGRSTTAAEFAAQACAIEADTPLAEIVLAFVNTAHLPDWAFQRAAV